MKLKKCEICWRPKDLQLLPSCDNHDGSRRRRRSAPPPDYLGLARRPWTPCSHRPREVRDELHDSSCNPCTQLHPQPSVWAQWSFSPLLFFSYKIKLPSLQMIEQFVLWRINEHTHTDTQGCVCIYIHNHRLNSEIGCLPKIYIGPIH